MKLSRNVRERARKYIDWGWCLVPIPSKEKAPRIAKWQQLRLKKSDVGVYFDNDSNIGVLLGEASKNLVDIDLDCEQAIFLAPTFLPHTRKVHGRKSKRGSHHWYRTEYSPKPEKFSDVDGTCLVEIRSTGQQTVLPPSIHPSGERLRWEEKGRSERVSVEELTVAVKRLAAAALIARHWPGQGTRNEASLALAGMLQRADWDELEIGDYIAAIATVAGDEEWADRKMVARSTKKRMEDGGPATGRPRFVKLLGADVADRVCMWLGIGATTEPINLVTREAPAWPKPLAEKALYGIAGEVVRAIAPHTEADLAALLIQFLAAYGNVIGRSAYVPVGAMKHYANLYCVVVGQTSRARKGTAWAETERFFRYIDEDWLTDRMLSGLGSGEGLIWAVRDAVVQQKQPAEEGRRLKQKVEKDPGVQDKRLLVMETEFASILKVIRREGTTLSPVIRRAWDKGDLQNATKNSPAKATGAHISIVGHITRDEVLRDMSTGEGCNGFANRFLWVCAKRSQLLPFGGRVDKNVLNSLRDRLERAVEFGRKAEHVPFTEKAKALWIRKYPKLTADRPGLFGSVTSRSEAQVLRLALIYALLGHSRHIKTQHLKAAFAVWCYCEASAHHIFGGAVGNFVADKILLALRKESQGLTRTRIRGVFSRNRSKSEIARAITVLVEHGLARCQREETAGRPVERWFAI